MAKDADTIDAIEDNLERNYRHASEDTQLLPYNFRCCILGQSPGMFDRLVDH